MPQIILCVVNCRVFNTRDVSGVGCTFTLSYSGCRWTDIYSTDIDIYIDFLQYNQLDALISLIYFWNENLHVLDSSSIHHQEFFTIHTGMVYVIQVCGQLASRIRMEHDIYHCCMYSEKLLMMD